MRLVECRGYVLPPDGMVAVVRTLLSRKKQILTFHARSAILFSITFIVAYTIDVDSTAWPPMLSLVLGIVVISFWFMQTLLVSWTLSCLDHRQSTTSDEAKLSEV
jgi:hypothetical protein